MQVKLVLSKSYSVSDPYGHASEVCSCSVLSLSLMSLIQVPSVISTLSILFKYRSSSQFSLESDESHDFKPIRFSKKFVRYDNNW